MTHSNYVLQLLPPSPSTLVLKSSQFSSSSKSIFQAAARTLRSAPAVAALRVLSVHSLSAGFVFVAGTLLVPFCPSLRAIFLSVSHPTDALKNTCSCNILFDIQGLRLFAHKEIRRFIPPAGPSVKYVATSRAR